MIQRSLVLTHYQRVTDRRTDTPPTAESLAAVRSFRAAQAIHSFCRLVQNSRSDLLWRVLRWIITISVRSRSTLAAWFFRPVARLLIRGGRFCFPQILDLFRV